MSMHGDNTAPARVAVFDLDGTLLRGQSQWRLARFLFSKGVFGLREAAPLCGTFLRYLFGLGHVNAIRRDALRVLRGCPVEHADRLIQEFVRSELIYHLRWEALAEIDVLRSSGMKILIASAAIEPLVRSIAAMTSVDGAIATALEVRDGVYTGCISGEIAWGEAKRRLVESFAQECWPDCTVAVTYSDHSEDLPLLTLAEQAIVVNPATGLRRIAARRGWTIRRWR